MADEGASESALLRENILLNNSEKYRNQQTLNMSGHGNVRYVL